MNKLLPDFLDLQPIKEKNRTFSECCFTDDFDNLSFADKLKVVNDIVRQSILPSGIPNPSNEVETLIGDCHTSVLVSIDYLSKLGIGENFRYVLAKNRVFDPDDVTTRHALLLVDDEIGNTYQYDATPYVGYNYGIVKAISNEKIYEHYEEMCGSKYDLLYNLRKIIYELVNDTVSFDYKKSLLILAEAKKHIIFNGYVSLYYRLLSNFQNQFEFKKLFYQESLCYNQYINKNSVQHHEKRERLLVQLRLWKEELTDLTSSNLNYKRQLELSQWIVQEEKMLDLLPEKKLKINGQEISISHLSPRFFFENQLNVVMIKPSAYYLGVRSTIRERLLKKGKGALDEYFVNLSKPTTATGVKPVMFSHSLGADYERSLNDISDVILLKKTANELCKLKKELRSELGKNLINREVIWSDGEKILWHPFVTNLVHSTDNYSESCMHYLIGYPEYQLMTRFMYPNPNLEKVKKYERI